ncbi:hypothetical protein Ahy_A10g050099 [Arachis hypogaea]|uniref:Zinc knuckle CX2CX4HX4C domain-containing protein n=1 Tax=Arachis hypogaea TaxID=3818 RepID=A0A445B8M2_ARAHY|nr:hypothetical protein Ahy_A10g050099 [Arachis hypogaea]
MVEGGRTYWKSRFYPSPDVDSILGLPEHYKTKHLGWKLGCSFGDVLDVDIFQVRGKEHSIVKVQISLDITRPIKRFLRIVGPNNKVLEVGLKYERIGNFCNYCGYVRHEARMCSFQLDDSLKGEVKEERWGEWLKSDQSGKRENHTEDNFDSKVPINKKSRQNKITKPIPVNLIKSLASLSMQSQQHQKKNKGEKVMSKD